MSNDKLKLEQLELKEIKEFPNYSIYNDGRVISNSKYGKKGHELNQFIVKGYYRVSLYHNGKAVAKNVHRLVAQSFISNPENKPQVNHKDGDKLNNNVTNLEWVSAKENTRHAIDSGLSVSASKGRKGYEAMRGREIHQYDLQGKYLKSYGSIREAARKTSANISGISLCAQGKLNKSGGFIWKY